MPTFQVTLWPVDSCVLSSGRLGRVESWYIRSGETDAVHVVSFADASGAFPWHVPREELRASQLTDAGATHMIEVVNNIEYRVVNLAERQVELDAIKEEARLAAERERQAERDRLKARLQELEQPA